jgi:outer membrane protein OmpA-like peptidoglycan-associated protein
MKTIKSINLFLFTLALMTMINCASEEPKATPRSMDDVISKLNQELMAFEIQGFAGDQTVLPEGAYKKWANKAIAPIKLLTPNIPPGYKLAVTGHADPDGGEEKASRIAQGRADSTKARVAKDLGIDASTITTKNYSTQKFESKKSSSVSRNRRVEFEVVRE